jgi:serine/threonine protein kinase
LERAREVSDVTTGSIGPGTVLADRYRLDDLLTESAGARFWRATDTILARSVAIHAVLSDDPRAPHLLEAARVSATVTDPHLLRVLDCDDRDGITWVVHEWGDGISLDLMLQRGTLPAARAAWLTREVAEAIAAGHAQGVAHGRLNPEAVLVTHAGAVKLIGYVVDAALELSQPQDPLYGELDDREADVINLAGILYAALTGRWPGVARSAVPKAPRESRRPLRPRQVRAGVPRTLDAICERVLHKEASQHTMPIETAHEIAAALADFVGDPALTAPLTAAGMHAEPELEPVLEPDPDATQQAFGPALDPEATQWVASPQSDPEATQQVATPETDPEATQQVSAPAPVTDDHEPSHSTLANEDDRTDENERTDETDRTDENGADDGDDTQFYRQPVDDSAALAPLSPPADEDAPPSPFPDIPERPLFASTERRVPTGARAGQSTGPTSPWSTPRNPDSTGSQPASGGNGGAEGTQDTGAGPEFWPFAGNPDEDNDVHTGKEGRGWLRTAIVIGVLLVLVVAVAIAFNRGRQDGAPQTDSGPSQKPSSSAPARGSPVELAGVSDFDPFAEPPEENSDEAPNAIDGDAATSWTTSTYRGNPVLGGLKPGVGLMVDLGKDREVRSVTIRFKGAPTSFEVYAAPAGVTQPPDSIDQLDKVAARKDAPQRANVQLDPSANTRHLLVWLTKLPEVPGGFKGEITDITVRS